MKPLILLCVSGSLWIAALTPLPARPPAADRPIRVLIVDGFSNHDWRLTTALIRGVLEPTGLFEIAVSTSPTAADAPGWDDWRPRFADFDVVIQNCNDIGGGPQWPREVRTAFTDFVRGGGGVYAWHSANNAFPGWPEYNDMIGLGWRPQDYGWALAVEDDGTITRIPPGSGQKTGHGPRFDALVVRRGEHPIHAGLPRRWRAANTEVYNYVRGPAAHVDVLAYANDEVRTRLNWPVEWTVRYGQGRVYTSTFGHVWKGDTQPVTLRCAGLQTIMVRALQWLAQRPVTFPIPPDFPAETAPSVRGEIPLPAPIAPARVP